MSSGHPNPRLLHLVPAAADHGDSSAASHGGGAADPPLTPPPPPPRHVRLICSAGGRILPRPHDRLLRYVGGETHVVSVPRSASLASLLSLLPTYFFPRRSPNTAPLPLAIKYQRPHEDLAALVSLTSDDDVAAMMDELDRLNSSSSSSSRASPRLRLFLFPSSSSAGDDTDRWFLDAINGGAAATPPPQALSEGSSVVSDPPDYLFGFDTSSSASSSPVQIKPLAEASPVPCPIMEPVALHPVAFPIYYVPPTVPVYYYEPAPVHGESPSFPVEYVRQVPVGFKEPVRESLPDPVYVGGPPVWLPAVGGEQWLYPVDGYEPPAPGGHHMHPPGGVSSDGGRKPPAIAGWEMWASHSGGFHFQ